MHGSATDILLVTCPGQHAGSGDGLRVKLLYPDASVIAASEAMRWRCIGLPHQALHLDEYFCSSRFGAKPPRDIDTVTCASAAPFRRPGLHDRALGRDGEALPILSKVASPPTRAGAGESGTGKELVARPSRLWPNAHNPFLPVDWRLAWCPVD